MKTLRLLFSILIFGLLWLPQTFYGAESNYMSQEIHSESCTQASNDMEDMSCCSRERKPDQKHDCNDKCQGNSCHCSSVHAGLSWYLEATNIDIEATSNFQKLVFYYQSPQLSTTFDNIWQPPKIS